MPSFKTVNYLNILQEVVPEMLNAKPGHLAARRWESATHYTFLYLLKSVPSQIYV